MKRDLSLIATVLALTTLACNSIINLPINSLKIIPTETYSIDELLAEGEAITDAILVMAASSANLTLAGSSDGIIEGQIQYNVAEWKPIQTLSSGSIMIEQKLPDGKIGSTPDGSINQWNIKLGNGLKNVEVKCSSGNYRLHLTNTLPEVTNISVEMGTGNLRLVIPSGAAANVDVNSGPVSISTEGEWMSNGNSYTTGRSSSAWKIKVEIGVGKLTLASE